MPEGLVSLRPSDRVDRLDLSLFDELPLSWTSIWTTAADRCSLLALHAALASRGDFTYLEVGSSLGAFLQPFCADPRCREIISIGREQRRLHDEESLPKPFHDAPVDMLDRLSRLPGADLNKLTTIDAGTDQLDPDELRADLCFINGEHTDAAVLRDARFCRRVVRDRGVLVFHHRTFVDHGIRQFLRELEHYQAYPLSHDLFVVEIRVPSLTSDARVRGQVPRSAWLVADRVGQVAPALSLVAGARQVQATCGRILLTLGAPRRRRRTPRPARPSSQASLFEIYTFVNDSALYEEMREAFIEAGFSPDAFVALADDEDDPYAAITRIGQQSTARYQILCHQDVRPDRGSSETELAAALQELDEIDPDWIVAGGLGRHVDTRVFGVTRNGRGVRCLADLDGRTTGDSRQSRPVSVVTLDECFLVFNGRRTPRCSAALSAFHLYGSDVCLHALASGGGGYLIGFPIIHLGSGLADAASVASFEAVKDRFTEVWSERLRFCYVAAPCGAMFMSRSRILRRLFGSALAMSCIGQARRSAEMRRTPRW